ncbi:MAG: Crp/Fnr family transcriptional regulator [Rhodocyclaceae bacterium]
MQQEKIDIPTILKSLPMFHEISLEQIATLVEATREKRLQKSELLFQRGDPAKGFYVVVSGQVKLAFSSAEGHEKVVDILGPRQTFGEAVMFLDRSYPVFAQALTDAEVLHVSQKAVFDLLEHDASFARSLLAGLSIRLHGLVQDVESLSLRSSAQRLIGYLLQQCGEDAEAAGTLACELPTSKQTIASRLNLTPETFSRILHDLSAAGLISVRRRHIEIHDVQRLRQFEL